MSSFFVFFILKFIPSEPNLSFDNLISLSKHIDEYFFFNIILYAPSGIFASFN